MSPKLADPRYIIARRDLTVTPPPNKNGWVEIKGAWTTLAEARAAYDQGHVEMCQGRDGNFATQYAIPRDRRAVGRIPLFGRSSTG
jgi:hypothetical protein